MLNSLLYIHLCFILLGVAHAGTEKMVYGVDDRKTMDELDPDTDAKTLTLSKSVLAQIPNWRIEKSKKSEVISVKTRDLQSGLKVCSDQKFLDMPLVSACTAFLVGPDLIVTAGHCIKDKFDCKKQTWVLDYDSKGDFISPNGTISFPVENTYSCVDLVSWSENTKLDFALIKLDRVVEDRAPLKIRREGKVNTSESLMVIGHPLGLPKMMADNIFIRDNSPIYAFKTNADTFSGNSGSPVFGLLSGLVEGILVRGDDDFHMDINQGCSRVQQCQDKECRGESVQRSTFLPFKYIPKI